jgi:hypothetical protein
MNAKETLIAALTGISLLASPVAAGGPVVVEDHYDTAEPAPRNDWIIPVIIGGVILCAIACGGDDDAPVVQPPKETCFKDC